MSYFYDCRTQDQAKAKFKMLAKELHPDKGGTKEAFTEMQRQYEGFTEDETINNQHNPFHTSFSDDKAKIRWLEESLQRWIEDYHALKRYTDRYFTMCQMSDEEIQKLRQYDAREMTVWEFIVLKIKG